MNRQATRTERRPHMLFLCQTLPYPPDGGVNIRTFNVLRLLARHFDITALYFYRTKDRPSSADIERGLAKLREFGEADAFPIPQEHSRARFVADHLLSMVTRRAYTERAYDSGPFRARLDRVLSERSFDIVHVDSMDLVGYLPRLKGLPVVCVHHNVESDLLRRRAMTESSAVFRWYLRHQADLLEAAERRWCERVDLNVMVSAADMDTLRTRIANPAARFAVVPNGVDTETFQPATVPPSDNVIFIGGLNWFPNRDSLDFFAEQILPLLRAGGVTSPVRWIGRASPDLVARYSGQGVDLVGYVTDVRPHLADAACFIVPMRVGGGTRLKILDAWAAGKAVVSTSIGCEGLDARDGENILIRDSPGDFADAIRQILDDAGLRKHLETGARNTATATYDWEVIGRDMLRAYRAVLTSSA